ncbi:hypothetical protein ACGGZK_13400 [Agromyces sp. MMS24-K17]|uniref:hypothetical protein n=1 Tax=Agromyces sp. MMS24-K17 TaxID=3372850 RepID=UPI00375525FF
MFEAGTVTPTAPLAPAATPFDRVGELQSRIRGMEATRLDSKAVPTHPALSAVLPGGTLREGTVVRALGSTSLLMALLAGPSASGLWVAVAGIPDFGVEAARGFDIDLDRLVLVPDPGAQWLSVVAALADAVPVVAARPVGRVSPAEASRFAARLRQRGAVLIVAGDWPAADLVLEVSEGRWQGLDHGHGALLEREVVLRGSGRGGFGQERRATLRLPDRGLGVAPGGEPAEVRYVDFGRRAG